MELLAAIQQLATLAALDVLAVPVLIVISTVLRVAFTH
jgi:hypothetical protein